MRSIRVSLGENPRLLNAYPIVGIGIVPINAMIKRSMALHFRVIKEESLIPSHVILSFHILNIASPEVENGTNIQRNSINRFATKIAFITFLKGSEETKTENIPRHRAIKDAFMSFRRATVNADRRPETSLILGSDLWIKELPS